MSNNLNSEDQHVIEVNDMVDKTNWKGLPIMQHTPKERKLLKKLKSSLK